MGIRCGVDIVEISRIKQSFEKGNDKFRERIFTDGEIDYCEKKRNQKYESYAARFAAKEAVSKAFGTGFGKHLGWKDIEVVCDEAGSPYIALSEEGKKLLKQKGGINISISLSHCREFAVSYAVIEMKD